MAATLRTSEGNGRSAPPMGRASAKSGADDLSEWTGSAEREWGAEPPWEVVRRLTEVSIALSSERDLDPLAAKVVEGACRLVHAEGGALYTVEEDELCCRAVLNRAAEVRLGGAAGSGAPLPRVSVDPEGVLGRVALTGRALRAPAAGEPLVRDECLAALEAVTGRLTRSMLVLPLHSHGTETAGVLLLTNAASLETGAVVPFSDYHLELASCFAAQAALALGSARLVQDLQGLFESLVRVLAAAVDEKSRSTAGHIQRVTDYALGLAERVSASTEGPFAGVSFSKEELNELRIASLVHDIGKIVTPETIADKATKLEKVIDRIDLVRERFRGVAARLRIESLERRLEMARRGASDEELHREREACEARVAELESDLEFLTRANRGSETLSPESLERLRAIAAGTYRDEEGREQPLLTPDELYALSIRRGTITAEELQVMRNHVIVTTMMLSQIPFTRELRNVPIYAGQHHEKLNGSGYPLGLTAEDLPLQSRILAVADIYDALTASDRPYKAAYPREKVLAILDSMVREGELDADLTRQVVELTEEAESSGSGRNSAPPTGA